MASKGGRPRTIVRDPDTNDVVNGLSRRKNGVFYATGAKPYKSFGDDLRIAIGRYRAWKQHVATPPPPPVMAFERTRKQDQHRTRSLADWLPLEDSEEYLAAPMRLRAFAKGTEEFYWHFSKFLGETGLWRDIEVLELDAEDLDFFQRKIEYGLDNAEAKVAAVLDHDADHYHAVMHRMEEGYARHWAKYHDWLIGTWIKENPTEAAHCLGIPQLQNLDAIKRKPQSITLDAIADLFENKPVGNREYRRRFAKRFREFSKIIGVKTVKEIEVEHIEKYYARVLKDCKQGDHGRPYAKSRFDVVTAVLTYAHKRGRDKQEIRRVLDDCQMLEAPRNGTRPKAEPRPVTRDELHAILALADTRQTAVIMLGLNAAFDPVDIERLPLDTVDLKARVLHFNRIKADVEKPTPRIATLWPRTVKALRKYLKDCGHEAVNDRGERMFFATATGKTIKDGKTWISRAIWRPLRVVAGLPDVCKFKGLRKAAYTEGSQVSPRQADILLGHRLKGVSDAYLQRNPKCVAPACRAIEEHYFG